MSDDDEMSQCESSCSSSEGSIDIIYQLINVENFRVTPDKLYWMFEEFRRDEGHEPNINDIRAELVAKQFDVQDIHDQESSDEESEFDLQLYFTGEESDETEVDSEEEREMEEDIYLQDKHEEFESHLDKYLMEQSYLTGYEPDNYAVQDIYEKSYNESLSTQQAINEIKQLPISDEDKKEIEEFKEDTPVWLSEINIEQNKTDLCLNKRNFKNLVKEIANDCKTGLQFEPEVFEMLQHVSEDYLIKLFEDTQKMAIKAQRQEIMPKDMYTVRHLNKN